MSLKQYVKDSVARMATDANQAIYLENLLTSTLSTVFRKKFASTPWANGDLLFIDTSADPGAVNVQWHMIEDVGSFDTVADDATDLPQIDIAGTPQSNRAINIAGVIRYTEQQLAAGNMQGMFNVATEKGNAAKRSYSRTLNSYISIGSEKDNLRGVSNAAGRNDIEAAGAWAGTGALSPSDVADDFAAAYEQIDTATGGVYQPNTCVMPVKLRAAFKRQNSLAANDSIEKFLRDTYPEITQWVYDRGMNTAGRGGSACVCMFNRDPDVIRALVPDNIRPLVVRPVGLGWEMPLTSRFAGTAINVPPSIATIYGV